MNKIYLDENIFYIENFISTEHLSNILNELNDVEQEDNILEHHAHFVLSTDSLDAMWKDYYASELHNIFDNNEEFYNDTGSPLFLKYKDVPGDNEWAMTPHSDDTGNEYSDHVARGFVIFITDDFSGGEIKYINKDIIFKPKAGTLVCHPGTKEYEHGVLNFSGGPRVVFTGFVHHR